VGEGEGKEKKERKEDDVKNKQVIYIFFYFSHIWIAFEDFSHIFNIKFFFGFNTQTLINFFYLKNYLKIIFVNNKLKYSTFIFIKLIIYKNSK
jgi:hypothetical protein